MKIGRFIIIDHSENLLYNSDGNLYHADRNEVEDTIREDQENSGADLDDYTIIEVLTTHSLEQKREYIWKEGAA